MSEDRGDAGTAREDRDAATGGSSTTRRLRFLITPRWIALEVAVIAFTLACYFLLAPWQFDRSSAHDAEMAAVAAALQADTVSVSQLMSTDAPPADDARWRMVTATGHFVDDEQTYVRLRHDNNGAPANEVLAPFVTIDGVTLLTDRGYVPYVAVQQNRPGTVPPLPDGTVTITGRVQPNQTDPRHRPPSVAPDGRTAYRAASSAIVENGPAYRGFVQLTADSPGVIDPIGLPEDNARPFFSYAIQWLSFGAIAVFGLLFFIYKEFTDPVDGEIYVTTADGDGGQGRYDAGHGGDDAGRQVDGHTDPSARNTAATVDGPRRSRRAKKFDKSDLFDPT